MWGRSCLGTPIIWAITSTGKGVARSLITSIEPFASAASRSSEVAVVGIGVGDHIVGKHVVVDRGHGHDPVLPGKSYSRICLRRNPAAPTLAPCSRGAQGYHSGALRQARLSLAVRQPFSGQCPS